MGRSEAGLRGYRMQDENSAKLEVHALSAIVRKINHDLRAPMSTISMGLELLASVRDNDVEFAKISRMMQERGLDELKRLLDDFANRPEELVAALASQMGWADTAGRIDGHQGTSVPRTRHEAAAGGTGDGLGESMNSLRRSAGGADRGPLLAGS